MEKRVALFEVKAIGDAGDPNGEFEAILSVPTVDRDGEVVDGRAFEPLPAEIPIHKFHDFSAPVATAVPFYEGDILKARGTFDPDPESQAIRQKVGRSIRYMSVGFMAATRVDKDGVPHITGGELLEASFVSVPSNREAAILAVKAHGSLLVTPDEAREMEDLTFKRGRVISQKNESDIAQAISLLQNVLKQVAAPPDEAGSDDTEKSPVDQVLLKALQDKLDNLLYKSVPLDDPMSDALLRMQLELALVDAKIEHSL